MADKNFCVEKKKTIEVVLRLPKDLAMDVAAALDLVAATGDRGERLGELLDDILEACEEDYGSNTAIHAFDPRHSGIDPSCVRSIVSFKVGRNG